MEVPIATMSANRIARALTTLREHDVDGAELSISDDASSVGVLATATAPLSSSLCRLWEMFHGFHPSPNTLKQLRFVRCDFSRRGWEGLTWYGDPLPRTAVIFEDLHSLPMAGVGIRYLDSGSVSHSVYFALTTLHASRVVDLIVSLVEKLHFNAVAAKRATDIALAVSTRSWPQLVAVEAASGRLKLQSTIRGVGCLRNLGDALENHVRDRLVIRFARLKAPAAYVGCSMEPDGTVSWRLYSRLTRIEGLDSIISSRE